MLKMLTISILLSISTAYADDGMQQRYAGDGVTQLRQDDGTQQREQYERDATQQREQYMRDAISDIDAAGVQQRADMEKNRIDAILRKQQLQIDELRKPPEERSAYPIE